MDSPTTMNETVKELMAMCGLRNSTVSTDYKQFILDIVLIIVACKLCHLVLRYIAQPRIVSEFLVGILIANVSVFHLDGHVLEAFKQLEFIASSTYMFVLGLEMEPLSIIRPPGPEATIAYAGIVSTVFLTLGTYTLFHGHRGFSAAAPYEPRVVIVFTLMFAATSSPTVTRLTTELKLGKSDIGRRAIRAAITNDMICTLLICLLFALRGSHGPATSTEVIIILVCVSMEMLIIVAVVRPVFRWVNDQNPEELPMNEVHMVASVALTQILCYLSILFGYDTKVNSFLIGLALPREGRVSNFLISKINYILNTFILPLYFSMANLQLNQRMWSDSIDDRGVRRPGAKTSWLNLMYIVLLATVGKLSGTLAAGKYFGLHWLEAITIGVLLNIKGYLHIFFTFHSSKQSFMEENSVLIVIFAVMVTIIFTPIIVSFIVSHVRLKGGTLRLMGLQWYKPTSELRIMVGLQGPQNVPAAANIVEMLKGGAMVGVAVTAVDLIELTEHAASSLVYSQGIDAVTVTDDSVVQLREQIGAALMACMEVSQEQGLRLNRVLAISSFVDMHEDICCGAQDNLAMLIVLPFHKTQRVDGGMDSGNQGFRLVNQNVLQHATCSVGILVDRGLGRKSSMSLSNASLNIAVVFTGGADDREALAYAGCIAKHPGIRLMVIRFLPDKEAMAMAAGPGQRILTAVTDEEKEKKMKVDDDYFAGFYEQYIAKKGVGYMEKHVINGAEAVATLKVVEGGYQLFVVGKGREEDSVLTAGMSERAECPELGPIGDILASSDFSVTASVLVIQQHDYTKDSDLFSEEFLPL